MAGPNSTISEDPPPDLSIASGFRRGSACVRRDDGRHAGDPDSGLARQAGDRPASTATDRRRDEVGGRDGPPAGQPGGRRPRAGARAGSRPSSSTCGYYPTARWRTPSRLCEPPRPRSPRKRAFEFPVLTAARSGEVRLATWDEMDLDAGVWTIPAARMKAKRDHRVPLSGRALAILHDVQRLSDGTGLVFRSLRGKPLSNMTLSKVIKELGIAAVRHGFRSSFRDWAAERTSTPREVVEAALAHSVQNPTEAAYARSDLFERRRLLMDDWAAYLVRECRSDD